MSFTGKSPANTYKDILYVDNDNGGVTTTLKSVKSANGSSTGVSVSDRAIKVATATDNTAGLSVVNSAGTTKFNVDTSNNEVKALNNHVNTQFATFSITSATSASFIVNTHHALPFGHSYYSNLGGGYIPQFGTSTDPATTWTNDNSSDGNASVIVPVLWYLPSNIYIDEITSILGADTSTGDTCRFHLFSYTFNNDTTGVLTAGALLAHSADITNAGYEQNYLTTWTIDSASVTSGKVIVAFFRSDSINSDYSAQVFVKYHIT